MSLIEIYLDKEFVDQFILKSGSYDPWFFSNFGRFWNVLKNYRIFTNFSLEEWDEALRNQNVFVKNIYSSGRNPDIEFDQSLQKIAMSVGAKDHSSPFKLFFVENVLSRELNQFGFENITSDEFNMKWSLFFSEREDKTMQVTANQGLSSQIKLDSWHKFNTFSHPFHSLIIFDLYILQNKENEKMENNLFPMLLAMIKRNPNRSTIDLQIITQFKGAATNITDTYEIIKRWLDKMFGCDRVSLSIIVYSKDVVIRDFQALSFRRLFTNYFEISADKGFNFFRNNGMPGKLQDVKFEFIFFGYNSERIKTPLIEFKKYIAKVENKPEIGYQAEQINVLGTKNNRLLSFQN